MGGVFGSTSKNEDRDQELNRLREEVAQVRRLLNEEPLERQWRTGNLSSYQEKQRLFSRVITLCSEIPDECQNVNILMVGNLSSGKSSFTNTLKTAIRQGSDHIDTTATVYGPHHQSVTRKLHEITLQRSGRSTLRVFDCRGFPPAHISGKSPFERDLEKVVMGHIKAGYVFDKDREIRETDCRFRADPFIKDRMHCVLFVIKATNFSEDLKNYRILKEMQTFLEDNYIPLRIILTAVDTLNLCKETPLENIYKSRDAKAKMDKTREMFGLTDTHILPVVNYLSDDQVRIVTKDILALQALDNILQQALSFIENNI